MKKILFVSLILILSGSIYAQKVQKKMNGKEFALQLYSLRDDIKKDYATTIKKVGEMGFTAVEAAGYKDGLFYGKTPVQFKADIENNGMIILSSHVNRPLSKEELESGDFSASLKWWDECIDAHKATGTKYIVMPWLDVPKDLKDLKTYCNFFNEVGKRSKTKGILFGYHNHAQEFQKVEGQVMLEYMLENTNPEYVFFQMDVYWVVRGAASPVDFMNKYPKRFTLLHLKDNRELGQSGMVGFDAILKNTEVAGTKYLVVEVEKYSNNNPFESVKQSLDYLDRLISKL